MISRSAVTWTSRQCGWAAQDTVAASSKRVGARSSARAWGGGIGGDPEAVKPPVESAPSEKFAGPGSPTGASPSRPISPRAASGIPEFDALLDKAKAKAPTRSLVSIDDVGAATAFLAHDAAKLITGETLYIDGGYHIID